MVCEAVPRIGLVGQNLLSLGRVAYSALGPKGSTLLQRSVFGKVKCKF
jgi:hypothetical protein